MKPSKQTLLLLTAALMATFAAVAVRNRLTEVPAPVAVQEAARQVATHVLIAKRDLVAGSFVQSTQDLDWGLLSENAPKMVAIKAPEPGQLPKNELQPNQSAEQPVTVNDGYVYEGSVKLTDFNGAVVRRNIRAGEPVPQSALMRSGEGGFMSAVLENGMRAVSIAVNATSGNAGFVSPGDHVDLIVTNRIKTAEGGNNSDEVVVGQTFTENVRVVAVDQMLDNPENKAILAKTVTVEVTPRQAEQIAVAQEMGKISIALRSLTPAVKKLKADDASEASHEGKARKDIYAGDISATGTERKTPLVPRVMIIRGDKSENIDFYQGRP